MFVGWGGPSRPCGNIVWGGGGCWIWLRFLLGGCLGGGGGLDDCEVGLPARSILVFSRLLVNLLDFFFKRFASVSFIISVCLRVVSPSAMVMIRAISVRICSTSSEAWSVTIC